jgi:preprotein translocase subunit SecB
VSSDDVVLASSVSQRVDLQDVRTTHVRADLHQGADSGRLVVELEREIVSAAEADHLMYELRFALALQAEGDAEGGSGPVFTAEVHLALLYQVTEEGYQPDDQALDAFGQLSAMHTAYPYLREVLHTLTMRAGLPPLVLGTFLAPAVGGNQTDQVPDVDS